MNPILRMLTDSLGYQEGETVGIVYQEGEGKRFEASKQVCDAIEKTLREENVDVELFSYVPAEARNGVDAAKELYDVEKNILIMPTAYSLTHTAFTMHQRKRGTRIASMPGFTLALFVEDGPMDADIKTMEALTNEVAEKMKRNTTARITAKGTEMIVELRNDLVALSTAKIVKGEVGNLPGAEAYVVPKTGNGYFTVPAGWGGEFPLKYPVKFFVEDGRFVKMEGDTMEAQAYIDKYVKPFFNGNNFDVLAEFGIGTNPKATAEFVSTNGWSTLLAEKIYGSAHFANGNSKGMGGENDVPIHQDWVVPDVKIVFE